MNYDFIRHTVFAIGVSLAIDQAAVAKSRSIEMSNEIQNLSVKLRELEVRDQKHVVTAELGKADGWLKEADRLADRRRTRDTAKRNLERVTVTLELIDVLLKRAEAEEKAEAARARAKRAEEALTVASEKEKEVEARKVEIEGKVSQ